MVCGAGLLANGGASGGGGVLVAIAGRLGFVDVVGVVVVGGGAVDAPLVGCGGGDVLLAGADVELLWLLMAGFDAAIGVVVLDTDDVDDDGGVVGEL